MILSNYFDDNHDLKLNFNNLIDWDEIVPAYENNFHDAKTYKESGDERLAYAPSNVDEAIEYYSSVLDSVGEIMGKEVASRAAEMDREGLKYADGKVEFPQAQQECFRILQESGLQPTGLGRHYGGLGLPLTVQSIITEIASRADSAFTLAFASVNIADVVEHFGSPEMCDEYLPRLAKGELSCAMALTEPNYGSNLADIQTKAVQGDDGVWRLTGAKRFITHGSGYTGMPSVILTLARTGDANSGARGLSFFLVEGKDIEVAGIEKKMGLHCSPTCEVVYDESPGQLIGKTGYGLIKYSMGMMNAARISIAAQGVGVGAAAFAEAKKYASERIQFGKPIQEIPAVKRILDRMEREQAAMRMLLLEACRTVDLYMWRKSFLTHQGGKTEKEAKRDERVARWEKLADLFTPLCKYYTTEGCVRHSSDNLQIHGGAGYTEEYDAARIYRDARITTIYEGTTQLQIVGAIGGVVAGMSATGYLRNYVNEEMGRFAATDDLKTMFENLEQAVQYYKGYAQGATRDRMAFEVVEIAARFINGMLLERSLVRLTGADREQRSVLAEEYQNESLGIAAANLLQLKRAERHGVGAVRTPAAV
ncbi:MAG: acyl-CoA dehydrogenase family protein [bacterium]|nr:acyl-CoA dehydrogenase family protein [bacterium]